MPHIAWFFFFCGRVPLTFFIDAHTHARTPARPFQVDAVSSESMGDVRRWRRAQIVEESSTGRLRLSFETLSDFHDEWVSRDSANIAPPGWVSLSSSTALSLRSLLSRMSLFFFRRYVPTVARTQAGGRRALFVDGKNIALLRRSSLFFTNVLQMSAVFLRLFTTVAREKIVPGELLYGI